jgi:hypothetical protein
VATTPSRSRCPPSQTERGRTALSREHGAVPQASNVLAPPLRGACSSSIPWGFHGSSMGVPWGFHAANRQQARCARPTGSFAQLGARGCFLRLPPWDAGAPPRHRSAAFRLQKHESAKAALESADAAAESELLQPEGCAPMAWRCWSAGVLAGAEPTGMQRPVRALWAGQPREGLECTSSAPLVYLKCTSSAGPLQRG